MLHLYTERFKIIIFLIFEIYYDETNMNVTESKLHVNRIFFASVRVRWVYEYQQATLSLPDLEIMSRASYSDAGCCGHSTDPHPFSCSI